MRPLLAVMLLLPALGFGQTLVLTVNGATSTITGSGSTTTSTYAKNAGSCGNQVAGNWAGTGLTTACTTLQVWLTASACGAAPSLTNTPPDVSVYTAQIGQLVGGLSTDTFTFAFSLLPGFATSTDGGVSTPCGSVVDFTNLLCVGVTLKDSTGACTSSAPTAFVNMRYDNVPPDPPALNVTPLDSKLSVQFIAAGTGSAVTDIQSFQGYYAAGLPDGGAPDGGYVPFGGVISVSNPNATISGLTNGANYFVEGYSIDEATNISGPTTPPVEGTPVLTYGFYANYLDDGGQPAGGCGDAGGGAPSAFAFLTVLLLVVARRRG